MKRCLAFVACAGVLGIAMPARAQGDKETCARAYTDAQSLRSDFKLVEAREQLRACSSSRCSPFMGGGIVKDCTSWLAAVDASIPSVVFTAHDAAGADVVDVTVSMDGATVAKTLDGHAIDVNPGTHLFTFRRADGTTVDQRVVVLEGKKDQVVSATFAAPSPSPPQPAQETRTAPPPPPPPVSAATSEESSSTSDDKASSHEEEQSEPPKRFRRVWLGVVASFDAMVMPSADDVCKLNLAGTAPSTYGNPYVCLDDNGNTFPSSTAQNGAIQPGHADQVQGGMNVHQFRFVGSIDYAVSEHFLLGARIGFVTGTSNQSTFPPLHLELRATLLVGVDTLTSVAPYLFAGGGVAPFDGETDVNVFSPQQSTEHAWLDVGPAFATFGAGLRFPLSDATALMAGLHGIEAVGSPSGNSNASSAFLFGPELGFQFGL